MITLETAKLLKENGWDKPCTTNYHIHKDGSSVFKYSSNLYDSNYIEVFPTPSTDELLEALPDDIDLGEDEDLDFNMYKVKGNYRFCYVDDRLNEHYFAEHQDPSEALALLWIKLRKDKLI